MESKATRLSREEFEAIIRNYEDAGRDTTDLKAALAQAYPAGNPRGDSLKAKKSRRAYLGTQTDGTLTEAEMEERIDQLRQQATVSTGVCAICGQEQKLYSGVCESCFKSWAASALRKE